MKELARRLLGAWVLATAASSAQTPPTPVAVTIPLQGAGLLGGALAMHAEVFKPPGDGPFPVMVYAHGRSVTQVERHSLREVIPRQYVEFWLSRGFAAVGVARPGYGRTGGSDKESPGHSWDASGRCSGNFNPERVAENASNAIRATVGWVQQQPWARQGAVVVTGNSVGGMTAVAMGATPDGVAAVVNFAGGTGGNPSTAPTRSCMPDRMTELYAKLGANSRTPSLWLYARNDLFWGEEAPKSWHAAYLNAGAQNSTFVMTDATQSPDGHDLIFLGRALWEPQLDAFLKTLGL